MNKRTSIFLSLYSILLGASVMNLVFTIRAGRFSGTMLALIPVGYLLFKVIEKFKNELKITAEQFFKRYKDWSHGTFGTDTFAHGFSKLEQEMLEVADNPSDMTEWADCLMCFLYAFSCQFPYDDLSKLIKVAQNKLSINENREWIKQPDGTWKHKK